MGAVIAVLQNDANLMTCQLQRLGSHVALQEPGRPPEGYGYGYYTATEVLLGKRPSGAPQPISLPDLCGDVRSEALIAHARYATVGNHRDENTHPFRFRRWLFAHDGTIEGFAAIQQPLLAELPDFLRRHIQGQTDSEHAFALFVKHLRDAGEVEDHDVDARAVGRSLARTVRRLDELARAAGVQKASAGSFVATNGRVLVASRRGRPLFYTLLEGILPCAQHGLDLASKDSDPRLVPHMRVKAVCVASHLLAPNGFVEVPDGSVLSVSRELQVSVASLSS